MPELVSEIIGHVLSYTYLIVIISCIITILTDGKRNPVRTISWIIVISLLPYVGLFFYILFGRSYHRQKRISNKIKKRITNISKKQAINQVDLSKYPLVEKNIKLATLIGKTSELGVYGNNDIEIFTEGKKLLEEMLEDISKAKDHIHAEYFIIETDETGNKFKEALIKKAQEGVDVRVIYDDLGSWRLKRSTIRDMKKAGIKMQSFFKIRFPYFTSKINYRNHRKILIIDGIIGYLGGFNIADRYTKGLEWGIWRDTHLRIEGDAVAGLQHTFIYDWLYITKRLHTNKRFFPQTTVTTPTAVQIGISGPDMQWESIMQAYCLAISNAKKYIYIQTPYFLPNESIMNAIESAALSGVEVKLMIPYRSDERTSYEASMSYMDTILRAGVEVYQYTKGFIHSKTIVIDDEIAIIGSANIDLRSFEQNFEISAFIYDEKHSIRLKELFLKDMRVCKKLSYYKWLHRPRYRKFIQALARLLSPIL
jgi:cardiolipin synthase